LGASYRYIYIYIYEAGMLFIQHNPGSTILSLIISDRFIDCCYEMKHDLVFYTIIFIFLNVILLSTNGTKIRQLSNSALLNRSYKVTVNSAGPNRFPQLVFL